MKHVSIWPQHVSVNVVFIECNVWKIIVDQKQQRLHPRQLISWIVCDSLYFNIIFSNQYTHVERQFHANLLHMRPWIPKQKKHTRLLHLECSMMFQSCFPLHSMTLSCALNSMHLHYFNSRFHGSFMLSFFPISLALIFRSNIKSQPIPSMRSCNNFWQPRVKWSNKRKQNTSLLLQCCVPKHNYRKMCKD